MKAKLYGWESIKAIRQAFIEDYSGRVDEKAAAEFDRDMAGLVVGILDSSGYEESAHVLFRRGRKLFEVSASYCSCDGFEDQWRPEEVSWAQLALRPKGWASYDTKEAAAYVDQLVAKRSRAAKPKEIRMTDAPKDSPSPASVRNPRKPLTAYQRIARAADKGRGVRLSVEETFALSLDHAIETRAALDDEGAD